MHVTTGHEQLHRLSDGELVLRLKQGSAQALDVLLDRHSDALFRFCGRLTASREDAEDICQEAMARAITRVDSLQTDGAFRGWLFSIARNLAMDSYRSKRRVCPLSDEEQVALPQAEETPQERIEVREEQQTVAEALAKLTQSHQRVLVLREVKGLSYTEIASELDVSHSAVETLLFRARRRLREEYSKTAALPAGLVVGALRAFAGRLVPVGAGPLVKAGLLTAAVLGGAVAAPRIVRTAHSPATASGAESLHLLSAAQLTERHIGLLTDSTRVTSANGTSAARVGGAGWTRSTERSHGRPSRMASASAVASSRQLSHGITGPGRAASARPASVTRGASISAAPATHVINTNKGFSRTRASHQVQPQHIAGRPGSLKAFRAPNSHKPLMPGPRVGKKIHRERTSAGFRAGAVQRSEQTTVRSGYSNGRHAGRLTRSPRPSSATVPVASHHSTRRSQPSSGRGAPIQAAPTISAGSQPAAAVSPTVLPAATSAASSSFVPPGQLKKGTRP